MRRQDCQADIETMRYITVHRLSNGTLLGAGSLLRKRNIHWIDGYGGLLEDAESEGYDFYDGGRYRD